MTPSPPPDEDEDAWPESRVPSVPAPTWVRRTRRLVLKHWEPQPLSLPRVDPDLPRLSAVERSAEVFRYWLHKTEYWLSPKGWLREWLRFNIRFALLLIVPSLLITPLITFALGQFSAWAAMLAQTTSRMILFPLSALLIVGLVCGLIYIGRAILQQQRPRQRSYYE